MSQSVSRYGSLDIRTPLELIGTARGRLDHALEQLARSVRAGHGDLTLYATAAISRFRELQAAETAASPKHTRGV